MINTMWIKTDYSVWSSIKNAHGEDLGVFSSYSAPGGDMFGDPTICVMETEYGFKNADAPLIKAKTTWDRVSGDDHYKRVNEKHQYWIALVKNEEDD